MTDWYNFGLGALNLVCIGINVGWMINSGLTPLAIGATMVCVVACIICFRQVFRHHD